MKKPRYRIYFNVQLSLKPPTYNALYRWAESKFWPSECFYTCNKTLKIILIEPLPL